MAAVGDALRAASSFLTRYEALPSADAEMLAHRTILADALARLLSEGRGPMPPAGLHHVTDGSSATTPEAIDELERALDAAMAALDRVVHALTTTPRRPYR